MAIEKINLLSWNIHSTKYGITKLMEQILGELVNDHSIDIVILQEAFGNIILESLNSGVNEYVEVICPTKVTEQGIKIFLKKKRI